MTAAERAGARVGVAVALSLLAVGVFGLPEPFLATVCAFALATTTRKESRDSAFVRAGWAAAGIGAGLCLLVAFPQQLWIGLPVFACAASFGMVRALKKSGAGSAAVFAAGAAAAFGTGIPIVPPDAVQHAFAHLASILIAIGACTAADALLHEIGSADGARILPHASLACGTALAIVFPLGAGLFPEDALPMALAAAFTCIPLCSGPKPRPRLRAAGGFLGAALCVLFLTVLSGSGNHLVLFLGGLAGMLAGLAGLAIALPRVAPLFAQAGSALAVGATIYPAPPDTLHAALMRGAAVATGGVLAAVVFKMAEKISPRVLFAPASPSAQSAAQEIDRIPPRPQK